MVQPDGDLLGDGVNIASRLESIASADGDQSFARTPTAKCGTA